MYTFKSTETNTATPTAASADVPFRNNVNHKRRAKIPSFSSVLLDAIYHSIDDTDSSSSHSHHNHTPTIVTSSSSNIKHNDALDNDYIIEASKQKRSKMKVDSTIDLRHAIMIDSWIENQPPITKAKTKTKTAYYNYQNDPDSNKIKFSRQKSLRTKMTRTNSSSTTSCFTQTTVNRDTSSRIFDKTKLKALKIYTNLKKSKQQQQPVSPSARIAAFLNSMFRNADRPKTPSTSTCSSASSFSRSCLSKSTKSTVNSSNRSVRFYPVNTVIVDNNVDSTSGQFNQFGNRKYGKIEKEIDELMEAVKRNRHKSDDYDEVLEFEIDSEDEDDGESCGSSDLFELENLDSIGVSSISQELPVYGTTNLKHLTTL